jgi:hypothetical protein
MNRLVMCSDSCGLPNHVATDLGIGGVRLKDDFRVRDAGLSQAQPLGFNQVGKQARHADTESADLTIEKLSISR